MFYKNFSKCVIAGAVVTSGTCSLVFAGEESDKIKARINDNIKEIIKIMEDKMPEGCLKFFGCVKDNVNKLQNEGILKVVSYVFENVKFIEKFDEELFSLRETAMRRFFIFLSKAEALDKKIRDESFSAEIKDVSDLKEKGNDLIAALKVYYQSLNACKLTNFLDLTEDEDINKDIDKFLPNFLKSNKIFADFSKLYESNDKNTLKELERLGKSEDTKPIFLENKKFDDIIKAIENFAISTDYKDHGIQEDFVQEKNTEQANTNKITEEQDTKKVQDFKGCITNKDTKEIIEKNEQNMLVLRKHTNEYKKLYSVGNPKDAKVEKDLHLYSEKGKSAPNNSMSQILVSDPRKNEEFFEELLDDEKYSFFSKEGKEEIERYIESNSLEKGYLSIIDGAYTKILKFVVAENIRPLLESFFGRWLVSDYVVFKMNKKTVDFGLFEDVFKNVISLCRGLLEKCSSKNKNQSNTPIVKELINRCLDIAIESEDLSEESFLVFSKMKKYCNIGGFLKDEFLENLFSEISNLELGKKNAIDAFFYILSKTGGVVTEKWNKIAEENSNFKVNNISQSIKELSELRSNIEPSVNKVLKNFYRALILENYAAGLSKAYLESGRFFLKSDSDSAIVQDEDLKETHKAKSAKDQKKINFGTKCNYKKLENLRDKFTYKDSRESSPCHGGSQRGVLSAFFYEKTKDLCLPLSPNKLKLLNE